MDWWFNPMDFVSPFPPTAVDTEYKVGDDMLYGQALIGAGELQAAYVARRDSAGDTDSERASTALKYRTETSAGTADVILARHYDETVAGLGWTRPLGDAVVRVDFVRSKIATGDATSAVANIDYSWTWFGRNTFGRNTYGYLEYYRNGFGAHSIDLARLDSALSERLARGEEFTFGRDYLGTGLKIEITPLLKAKPAAILNLNDKSGVVMLRFEHEWRPDLMLYVGLDSPFGARGSEFGGLLVPATGFYSAPARQLFARIAHYF